VVSSDGTKAYVSNFSANTVTVLNLSSTPLPLPTVATTIMGFNQPSNLAITPNANTIYVSDPANNRMAILNTLTNMITGQITQVSANLQLPSMVPFFPGGFVVTPDQAPTAQFTSLSSLLASDNAAPSLQVTFDASGSSSPVGTIVSYAWDFGDGTTTITTGPIVTHTYTQQGRFPVTLTVTNSGGTSTTQIFTGRTVSNNGGPSAVFSSFVDISFSPLPPTNFIGSIERSHCLVLTATWDPSSSSDVQYYEILHKGKVIDRVSATGPFQFTSEVPSISFARNIKIVAVNSQGFQSISVRIQIIEDDD
jgi:PKD repeat protein